jgi:hypothetical protein
MISADIRIEDPRYNYSYKGFCSIIDEILEICLWHFRMYQNMNYKVFNEDMSNFFLPNQHCSGEFYDAGRLYLDDIFSGTYLNHNNAHAVANIEDLIIKNKIFNSIYKIKDELIKYFDDCYKELFIDDRTLAVHIRGTDKVFEVPEIPIESVFSQIDEKRESFDSIFLATDDTKYITMFIDKYGEDMIKYDKRLMVSSGNSAVHFSNDNRYQVHFEALQTAYLLSRSKMFMYCFSNLSHFALILGVNNFKYINNLNTGTEVYL